MKTFLRPSAILLGSLFILIQFFPYGRDHTDPPVLQEPSWDSPATRATAVRACFECHSNDTAWPWYSNIAPVSWLVYRDLSAGRLHLDFSEWGLRPEVAEGGDESKPHQHNFDVFSEQVKSGGMPPFFYLWLHPEARLSASEIETFLLGLQASLGN